MLRNPEYISPPSLTLKVLLENANETDEVVFLKEGVAQVGIYKFFERLPKHQYRQVIAGSAIDINQIFQFLEPYEKSEEEFFAIVFNMNRNIEGLNGYKVYEKLSLVVA